MARSLLSKKFMKYNPLIITALALLLYAKQACAIGITLNGGGVNSYALTAVPGSVGGSQLIDYPVGGRFNFSFINGVDGAFRLAQVAGGSVAVASETTYKLSGNVTLFDSGADGIFSEADNSASSSSPLMRLWITR